MWKFKQTSRGYHHTFKNIKNIVFMLLKRASCIYFVNQNCTLAVILFFKLPVIYFCSPVWFVLFITHMVMGVWWSGATLLFQDLNNVPKILKENQLVPWSWTPAGPPLKHKKKSMWRFWSNQVQTRFTKLTKKSGPQMVPSNVKDSLPVIVKTVTAGLAAKSGTTSF